MAQHEPTIASILQDLAEQYSGVVTEREVLDRVLARRPSRAKNPYASIRERLRFEATSLGWVRLGGGALVPLRVVLDGLRFRVTPSADEYGADLLLRAHLAPFVPLYRRDVRLEDADGHSIPVRDVMLALGEGLFGPTTAPALTFGEWFLRTGFVPGDSLIVTVVRSAPLTLRIEHEPASAFRLDDVLQQERELIDALAEHAARARGEVVSAEECVLPAYALAPWRTGYPGRPWRDLVSADPRIRLMDGLFLTAASSRHDEAVLAEDEDEGDNLLLMQIANLQREMLESRRAAAVRDVWNGVVRRASTARIVPGRAGSSNVVVLDPVSALEDHTAHIEERLEEGGYDEEGWSEDYADAPDYLPGSIYDDDFDDLDDDEFDADDPLLTVSEIDDLRTFMEQNPALAAAAQRLMAALTPEEVERLQHAGSPEEVQNILAYRFHKLLPDDPSLFATLVPYTPEQHEEASLGLVGDVLFAENEWDDPLDHDALIDDSPNTGSAASDLALERSSDLMERFYQHILSQGKTEGTAASRTGDLWVYADFLASYYDATLAEADYATLDECLFFYYPRKVLTSSSRAVREMCTSIKQFYAFLRAEGLADDTFAREMWRRRDQAARVVELYQAIDGESEDFERLFARLFAPYTA